MIRDLIQVGFERLMKDYLEDKVQEERHE
jgi:hypothetical protein